MRRGQITIFIILGLVVLLAVGIVIYFTSTQVSFRQGVLVSREAQPVYDFVATCAAQTAQEAIVLQGLQGGFLRLPPDIARTPASYVPMDDQNFIRVPLWFFEGESRIPSLQLMEADIKAYVDENIETCIDDFSAFEEQYEVIAQSAPSSSVTIADEEVTIRLDYAVQIQRPDRTVDVPEIVAQSRVNLKGAHDLAVRVIERENRESWFENLTIDLMTMNPAIPFDGLEFDCSPKEWRLTTIQAEVQEMMRFNLPAVRIENTNYAPFAEREREYRRVSNVRLEDMFQGRIPSNTPDDVFEHNRMLYDVGLPKTDVSAAFIYDPAWGLDINGQPNRNGVMSSKISKGASQYLSFLCTNVYHFTYDVIYPVVLIVRDENAFLGQGFTFQMAFPVIIDDNEGARKTFGFREFRGFEQATGFCDDLGDEVFTIVASGLEPGIGVVELSDVLIQHECITNLCNLGETAADSGFYRLRTRVPAGCSNPSIVARKDGYLPARGFLTGDELDLVMPRLREMKVQFVKHPYDSETGTFLSPRSLGPNENVTLFVSVLGEDFNQFVTFPSENNTIQLIDGTDDYSFNAVLTLFNDLTGGYQTENITFSGRDLQGTDTITINVVQIVPILQTDEYKRDLSSFILEGSYVEELRPEFS